MARPTVGPSGIAANPNNNKVYVAEYGGEGVAVIDGNTNKLLETLKIPSPSLEPMAAIADVQNNNIYISTYFGIMHIIDSSTDKFTGAVQPVGSDGFAINYGGDKLYAASYFNNKLDVIDIGMEKIAGSVGVGLGPWGVAFYSALKRLYTANLNDGTVTVLEDA